MSCGSCGNKIEGVPPGCGENGSCITGTCNKLNTYNWLTNMVLPEDRPGYDIMEVSFNKGSRKAFHCNKNDLDIVTGDHVVIKTDSGFDIGQITLQGELVRLQMKKKKVREGDEEITEILRKATEKDLENCKEIKDQEKSVMVRSRAIAKSLGLEMKIGSVEFQGDGKKATFYYTADGRVDFRELIKAYAREFRIKVEMRQIGARQESGMIGGIGDCGRELCCSTWLTDFNSVSTSAARYQNLAVNTDKLSGQCGRLKCCLNYELDTYLDALNEFPKKADKLKTGEGTYFLQKTDILRLEMVYKKEGGHNYYSVPVERVNKILIQNKEGKTPDQLLDTKPKPKKEREKDYDLVGQTSLSSLDKTQSRRKKPGKKNKNRRSHNRKKG